MATTDRLRKDEIADLWQLMRAEGEDEIMKATGLSNAAYWRAVAGGLVTRGTIAQVRVYLASVKT